MSKNKAKKDNIAVEFDKVEKRWLPTIGGNMSGYAPEYKKYGEDNWLRIPTERVSDGRGVPYPYHNGGVLQMVFLHSYAQAQTIAWAYKTMCEANADMFTETRVAEYEVVFDIKARRMDESSA